MNRIHFSNGRLNDNIRNNFQILDENIGIFLAVKDLVILVGTFAWGLWGQRGKTG